MSLIVVALYLGPASIAYPPWYSDTMVGRLSWRMTTLNDAKVAAKGRWVGIEPTRRAWPRYKPS